MTPRESEPDVASEPAPERRPPRFPQFTQFARLTASVSLAVACESAVQLPWFFLRSRMHAEHIAAAIGTMLLSGRILSGYVGGRVAARAGVSHDDDRMHWALAWAVTATFIAVASVVAQWLPERPSHDDGALFIGLVLHIVVVTALVRFGFAIGTWVQAFRDGRVRDDEREDGVGP